MYLDVITLQECLDLCQIRGQAVVINDGRVIEIKDETAQEAS